MRLAPSASFLTPIPPAAAPAPVIIAPVVRFRSPVSMDARRWITLAIGSLVIAGLLSLAVVVGRLPGLSRLIDDPLFFKRCLVVHVDLSLLVWFYAFLAGLVALTSPRSRGWVGAICSSAAVVGVGAMLVGGLVRGAQPVLANYIPVIDHSLFLSGLVLFFAAVIGYVLHALWRPQVGAGALPPAAAIGVKVAAVAVVLAAVTWLAARSGLPGGLDAWTFFEFTAWGPGHVLQVANAAMMLAVWLWVIERATGRPVLSPRAAGGWFALLLAPHLVLPLLTLRGTLDTLYHSGATQLMRWGIFPVVLTLLALGVRHLWRHRPAAGASPDPVRTALLTGLAASAGLTLLGFILGACIRSSTTLVPAHYHASLGGVTMALMLAAYLVAEAVAGPRPALWRSARRQLALFGGGQAVFALGFAIGGAYGLGRKAYAAEQQVRSAGEYTGLVVMGLGGLVAVAGGLWFLFLALRELRGWWPRDAR
jgi:cytochrome c oxidase subunit I